MMVDIEYHIVVFQRSCSGFESSDYYNIITVQIGGNLAFLWSLIIQP